MKNEILSFWNLTQSGNPPEFSLVEVGNAFADVRVIASPRDNGQALRLQERLSAFVLYADIPPVAYTAGACVKYDGKTFRVENIEAQKDSLDSQIFAERIE